MRSILSRSRRFFPADLQRTAVGFGKANAEVENGDCGSAVAAVPTDPSRNAPLDDVLREGGTLVVVWKPDRRARSLETAHRDSRGPGDRQSSA